MNEKCPRCRAPIGLGGCEDEHCPVFAPQASQPPQGASSLLPDELIRVADAIDPLKRTSLDNLTCSVAAQLLRQLAASTLPAPQEPALTVAGGTLEGEGRWAGPPTFTQRVWIPSGTKLYAAPAPDSAP